MAADYKAPPPSPPVRNWTGFYVGLNAGGLWSRVDETVRGAGGACDQNLGGCFFFPNYSALMAGALPGVGANNTQGSFLGGVQIGYNWQVDAATVFGFEADIQGVGRNNGSSRAGVIITPSPAFPAFPLTTAFTDTQRLNYIGTVRGRFGFLATPQFLLYATGGLAYGGINSSTTISQTIPSGLPNDHTDAFGTGGASTTRAGYTVGAGAEWLLGPSWSVKAEYLYYSLGAFGSTVDYSIPLAIVSNLVPGGAILGSATANISPRFTGSIARVGLNWHFGGGPVYAKY
jgi:outer membrane immunogenic protein